MRRFLRDEKGMIMIEGLIVFVVTTILLIIVISVFNVLYQIWNVQSVANDTASKLAQTYSYSEPASKANMVDGSVSALSKARLRPYRYMINKSGFEDSARERARSHGINRLSGLIYYAPGNTIDVKTEIIGDSLARRHVEVTVTHQFNLPLRNLLEYIGLEGALVYTAVGYADCIDMLDYLTTVDFVDHATDPNYWFKSKTVKAINGLLSLIGKFVND